MNVEQPKKKNKKTLIVIAVVVVLAIIGSIAGGDDKKKGTTSSSSVELTQQQKDSVAKKELVESAFSKWDGSHKNLVELVKKSMHNPKSFEHSETRYWIIGDSTVVVSMEYRGTNAFGGVVTNNVKVETTLDGTITKVFE